MINKAIVIGGSIAGLLTARVLVDKLMSWYFNKLAIKAATDAKIQQLFIQVHHLLKSPMEFYHPSIIFKVLWG